MFVRDSVHQEALKEHRNTLLEFKAFVTRWNKLIDRINDLGGEEFLEEAESGKKANSESTFSQKEINQLINLCHPDKHGGKESANDITKKLLEMRK